MAHRAVAPTDPAASSRHRGTVQTRALSVIVACAGLLVLVYVVAVRTPMGQRFEDWVLAGIDRADGGAQGRTAAWALTSVNGASVVAALLLVVGVGLWRRQAVLAAVSAGVLVCSVLAAEVVQRVATRPILLDSGYRREDQSFPSGHTAVAMAIMCAVVLVVPYRIRGWTLVIASVASTGIAVATVSADWHRPSDTLGSDLIVVGCAAAGVFLLARLKLVRAVARGTGALPGRGSVLPVAAGTVVLLAGAALVLTLVRGAAGSGHSALVAGEALALAGGTSVAIAMHILLRGTELTAGTGHGDG